MAERAEGKEAWRDFITPYNHVEGECSQVGAVLCSKTNDRTRGNGLQEESQRRFRLYIRKNVTEGVVKHWNKLPREVMDSLSLEVFKTKQM